MFVSAEAAAPPHSGVSIRSMRSPAALRPISSIGCRIVREENPRSEVISMSSKWAIRADLSLPPSCTSARYFAAPMCM